MINIVLLIIGFFFLLKGADWVVKGASSIAQRLKISEMVVGLTIIAFGTSAPELFVNIIASVGGNSQIAIGTALGSNIANIFLVLGIASIILPLAIPPGTVRREIPISLFAAVILAILMNDSFLNREPNSVLSRSDGMILLLSFLRFMYYYFSIAKKANGFSNKSGLEDYGLLKSLLLVVSGLIGLTVGAKWIIEGSVFLATQLGVSQTFIGLSVVAFGTSLPEMVTAAMAAYKKRPEIAVGTIVGSNIFNIFLVLGVSAVIHPIDFEIAHNLDVGFVILASVMLFSFVIIGEKHTIERWSGCIFLAIYIIYIVLIFIRH